jgi:hypothetical protein
MKEVKEVIKTAGLNIKQKFASLGLSTDSLVARIEGFSKSVSDRGTWYIMVLQILVNNKFEQFVAKLNAGVLNEDHIARVNEFFDTFKVGDYMLTNLNIRQAGEKWQSEDGKNSGIYETSYINIPFTSDMLFQGENAVENIITKETKYANIKLKSLELKED